MYICIDFFRLVYGEGNVLVLPVAFHFLYTNITLPSE